MKGKQVSFDQVSFVHLEGIGRNQDVIKSEVYCVLTCIPWKMDQRLREEEKDREKVDRERNTERHRETDRQTDKGRGPAGCEDF